jgi:hypothetical protein
MEHQSFQTADLYLAAYLLAIDLPISGHSSEDGTTTFVFDASQKLSRLVEDYYDLKALVNPQKLASAIKSLKNILYETNKNKNANHEHTTTASR